MECDGLGALIWKGELTPFYNFQMFTEITCSCMSDLFYTCCHDSLQMSTPSPVTSTLVIFSSYPSHWCLKAISQRILGKTQEACSRIFSFLTTRGDYKETPATPCIGVLRFPNGRKGVHTQHRLSTFLPANLQSLREEGLIAIVLDDSAEIYVLPMANVPPSPISTQSS
jgi:hypothetical protein